MSAIPIPDPLPRLRHSPEVHAYTLRHTGCPNPNRPDGAWVLSGCRPGRGFGRLPGQRFTEFEWARPYPENVAFANALLPGWMERFRWLGARHGLPEDASLSAGYEGILLAIRTYLPGAGTAFATWLGHMALHRIRTELRRGEGRPEGAGSRMSPDQADAWRENCRDIARRRREESEAAPRDTRPLDRLREQLLSLHAGEAAFVQWIWEELRSGQLMYIPPAQGRLTPRLAASIRKFWNRRGWEAPGADSARGPEEWVAAIMDLFGDIDRLAGDFAD